MAYTFKHGEIRTDVENAKIGVGKDDGNLQDLIGVQVFVETAVYDNASRPLVAYHGGLFRPKATSGNTGPSTWNPGLWESVGGAGGGLNIDGTVATVPDLPAHPHGGDGTMYMVTSTGDLYIFHQHETPQWKDVGHIQGPPGPKGATGASGADGAKGDKGDTGDAGVAGVAGSDGDPLQIDNTLSGADPTKALGAPQGKVLFDLMTTNTNGISSAHTEISNHATSIQANTLQSGSNKANIATNTAEIAGNTSAVNINKNAIAQHSTEIHNIDVLAKTNQAGIATNKTDITNNAARITQLSDGMHYVGNFHPTAAAEYPVVTGNHKNGSFWVVQGLGADTLYHMSTGDLAGADIADRDVMLWEEHAVSGKHWHVIGEAFDSHMLWEPGTHAGQIHYEGGRVGIGISNPSEKLHVAGIIRAVGPLISNSGYSDGKVWNWGRKAFTVYGISLIGRESVNKGGAFCSEVYYSAGWKFLSDCSTLNGAGIHLINGDGSMYFYTSLHGAIDGVIPLLDSKAVCFADGDVGIGTITPTAKLHVKETTAHHTPIVVEPHEITTPGIVLKGNEGWKTAGVTGCKYRKFPDGTVEIASTQLTMSGVLPSGYKPNGSLIFPLLSNTTPMTMTFLALDPGGEVHASGLAMGGMQRVRFYADGN